MATVANFSVSCTPELKAQLDAQVARESAATYISRSELVVKALTAYFNRVGAATPTQTTTFKELLAPVKEEIAAAKAVKEAKVAAAVPVSKAKAKEVVAVPAAEPETPAEEPVLRRRRKAIREMTVSSPVLIHKDEVA